MSNSEKKQLEAMLKQAQSLCQLITSMLEEKKMVEKKPKEVKPKRPEELKNLKSQTIDFIKSIESAYGNQWIYPGTPEIIALAKSKNVSSYVAHQMKKLATRGLVETQFKGKKLLRFRVISA
jgi:Mn-dependent DtxR family transcriptional regulator